MNKIRVLMLLSLLICASTLHAKEPAKDILHKLSQIKQRNPAFHIKLWVNQKDYRPGDKISFSFSTDRNCYLTIIDIATNGVIRVIFPNKSSSSNLVHAGTIYKIPGGLGFTMKIKGPAGIEKVKAIATTKPMDIFGIDFIKGDYFFFEGKPNNSVFTRGLGGLSSKLKKHTWAETELAFEIKEGVTHGKTRSLGENIGRPSPKPTPSAGTEEHGITRGLMETEGLPAPKPTPIAGTVQRR